MKYAIPLAMALAICTTAGFSLAHADHGDGFHSLGKGHESPDARVQLGTRPFYLVEGMGEGELKDRLMECKDGPFYRTDFSIGHRGAALLFPEHSDVAYKAGARRGAGIVECDETFTNDGELVCRHNECELATTTNIVATDLNNNSTTPWTGPVGTYPAPECCTRDLTLDEFKTLVAKMDASNPAATTAEGFLGGTAVGAPISTPAAPRWSPSRKVSPSTSRMVLSTPPS